jgi:hypothetical protein
MLRTTSLVPAICLVVLLACEAEEPAPSGSTGATDRAGADDNARLRSGDAAPGYLDLVGARVSAGDAENLRFVEELAAPLPANAQPPKGDAAIGWSFCLDTDAVSAPVGYPMTGVRRCEFVLRVLWNGKKLRGFLIDRRPLIEGRYSVIEKVEPTWVGTRSMQVVIPLEMLGSPERFDWWASTEEVGRERPGTSLDEALRSDTIHVVDAAPEGGLSAPATWQAR